jgi:chromosome segregation ATPase
LAINVFHVPLTLHRFEHRSTVTDGPAIRLFQNLEMSCSFRVSAIDNSSLEKVEEVADELDAEITTLQGQVDDARAAMDAVQGNLEHTQDQHEKEVAELSKKIQDAKAIAADALQKQEAAHNAELAAMAREFEQRTESMKALFSRNFEQNVQFEKIRRDLLSLGQETKLTDLKRLTERRRAKIQELYSKAELTNLENELKKRATLNADNLTVRRLEGEISDLQTSRREAAAEARLKITDLLTQIDLRRADHASFLSALQQDFSERRQQFEARIEMLQSQVEKERAQSGFEVKSAAEKCAGLQKMYQAISRRGNQQLSQLDMDIRMLRRALDAAEQSEQRFAIANREQMARIRTLQTEIEAMRRTAADLKNELSETRSGNAMAASVLRQSERSAERTHKRNSIFP